MSGCPDKDLHSIYLDGEMPEKFIAEYEAHVAKCPKCQAEIEKLKKVIMPFREDALNFKLDDNFLDQSFERLQTKLKYAQNTNAHSQKVYSFPTKWVVSFAAAAAVFAVVFAPIHLKTKPAATAEVQAIARTEMKPVAENKVVVDGNIDKSKISSALSSAAASAGVAKADEKAESTDSKDTAALNSQKVISATNLASSGGQRIISDYPDIDVFRPDFNNSPASVRIEFPDMNSMNMRQDDFERR